MSAFFVVVGEVALGRDMPHRRIIGPARRRRIRESPDTPDRGYRTQKRLASLISSEGG